LYNSNDENDNMPSLICSPLGNQNVAFGMVLLPPPKDQVNDQEDTNNEGDKMNHRHHHRSSPEPAP